MDKNKIKKYGIVGSILLLIIIGIIVSSKEEEQIINENPVIEEIDYDIIVEIKGEVLYPAIYTLPNNTRISDLISLAGGLTSLADTNNINQATKLIDGMIVTIPKKEVVSDTNKVNINTATKEELMTLSGIGEAKAQAIIDYRITNGNFSSIEDLLNVNGISETLFNTIKEFITK